jgi:hypothetical protein
MLFQMGYGKSSQKGCGIHLRQFSRAFIFDDGTKRAVFVSVDAGMMAHGVHYAVSTPKQTHRFEHFRIIFPINFRPKAFFTYAHKFFN